MCADIATHKEHVCFIYDSLLHSHGKSQRICSREGELSDGGHKSCLWGENPAWGKTKHFEDGSVRCDPWLQLCLKCPCQICDLNHSSITVLQRSTLLGTWSSSHPHSPLGLVGMVELSPQILNLDSSTSCQTAPTSPGSHESITKEHGYRKALPPLQLLPILSSSAILSHLPMCVVPPSHCY